MKFLTQIVVDHELKIPRKAANDDKGGVDWSDFNYPDFYPLIRYKPTELKELERKEFVDVR